MHHKHMYIICNSGFFKIQSKSPKISNQEFLWLEGRA